VTKRNRLKLREERPAVRHDPHERAHDDAKVISGQRSPHEPTRDVGGASEAEQADLLANRPLQLAQRQSLATQIVHTQGNQHVQRVVGTVQAQRGEADRDEIAAQMREILRLHQSKQGSLQLSDALVATLQIAIPRSAEQIKALWQPLPKGIEDAVKRLEPALPANLPRKTMERLLAARTNLAIMTAVVKPSPQPAPSPAKKETSPLQEQEALAKAIARMLQNKPAEDKSGNTEALTKIVQAYLETKQGKELKEKALRLLLSTKGLPFTLMTGTAALAAMVASNTTIPSTPEIPIGDNLSIKVEFEGTFQKPTGVKFALKWKFGGPKVEKREGKESTVLALPPELEAYIGRIDRQTLYKWFSERAFHDWEVATPEEEDAKLAFYKMARDKPEALGLPDAQLVAQHVARSLVEAAIANRIRTLEGKSPEKEVKIMLGHDEQWDRLTTLEGLTPRLQWMLGLLLPKVPFGAQGVEQVTFHCGKRPIPLRVKR
jgi:hypothetical protein